MVRNKQQTQEQNEQSKIIEKTGKYYEYEKMVMRLEKVE